jgi:hypothetical protein
MSKLQRRMSRREVLRIAFLGATAIAVGCEGPRTKTKRTALGVKRAPTKVRPQSAKSSKGPRSKAGKATQTAARPKFAAPAKRTPAVKRK